MFENVQLEMVLSTLEDFLLFFLLTLV